MIFFAEIYELELVFAGFWEMLVERVWKLVGDWDEPGEITRHHCWMFHECFQENFNEMLHWKSMRMGKLCGKLIRDF